ncbi:two-component system response regulator, partial [Enterobacter hormaechei]
MLVDDEPTNLHVLRQILGDDYRLQFATDGARALQLAQHQPPDLILL